MDSIEHSYGATIPWDERVSGGSSDEPEALGLKVAEQLLRDGAGEIISELKLNPV